MEVADVELVTERALRLDSKLSDLQLPDLIGQRLARPDDVPADSRRNLELLLCCVFHHEVDGLRPLPV